MARVKPRIVVSALVACAGLLCVASAQTPSTEGCCAPTAADFPKVGGNLGNQSYSSLSKIDRGNVGKLGGAWVAHLAAGAPPQYQQSTAVAVGGVIFVETTQGKVFAVDGRTGVIKWTFNSPYGQSLRRGVAVGDGLVFTATAQKHVVALNQATGAVVWDKALDEPGINSQVKVPVVYYDGIVYLGSNDGSRGVATALRADNGELLWKMYGAPAPGEFGNDTWEGESWKTGGASPWMAPAIDPQLGLIYWTFGNSRSGSAVNGATRGGMNLFANSLVALDLKTGKYRWHFQSVHHDIWDMDNVMTPVLADVVIAGKSRKAIVYGSKTGLTYILDRIDGSPLVGIEERPVPQDASQKTWPTQPYPKGDPIVPICAERSGKSAVRAPPNYEVGCLYTPHTDFPVVKSPGTGGAADWAQESFSPRTGLLYVGAGLINSAHSIPTAGVGFRPSGEERSGRIVAKDLRTNKIVWKRDMAWSLAHGNGILTTAGDVLFIGQPDGNLLGLDIRDGKELWRFQTGAGVHTTPITYEVDGTQYIAVFAGGNGLPYNSPQGDSLWVFKLGGEIPQAETPKPPPTRQPLNGTPVNGAAAKFTVTLARIWDVAKAAPGAGEQASANAMAPQVMTVPVGTTVTFVNPSDNAKAHCATQFFEGLFNIGPLKPGQSGAYTFKMRGEYFYNDCAAPQTTGKIVVQ
jgi:PQQ-dependent dehydrogenase (methanol/ethanol family)